MALRGDYLTIRLMQASSGVANEPIAETTSVNIDFTAEFLETTSQTDGLNQTGIAGKVSCVITGDYLLASAGTQFSNLFTLMNGGTSVEVTVHRSGTEFLKGDGVITGLTLAGGISDTLITGNYTLQCSGNMA